MRDIHNDRGSLSADRPIRLGTGEGLAPRPLVLSFSDQSPDDRQFNVFHSRSKQTRDCGLEFCRRALNGDPFRFARANIQIYDTRIVDLYQWVCVPYRVGAKGAEEVAEGENLEKSLLEFDFRPCRRARLLFEKIALNQSPGALGRLSRAAAAEAAPSLSPIGN